MDLAYHRKNLRAIFDKALQPVNGRTCVRDHLIAHPVAHHPVYLVAIGKAASAMAEGAFEILPAQITRALVITKAGPGDASLFKSDTVLLKSAHPVPDQRSLDAGTRLLSFIGDAPPHAHFLFLISGGTSSLVEVLPDGMTLAALEEVNEWLLGSGLDIHHINCVRKAMSRIKGGRLASHLAGRTADVLLISDVPGDVLANIGSGLLVADDENAPCMSEINMPSQIRALIKTAPAAPAKNHPCFARIKTRIIASNEDACDAAESHAKELGYTVYRHAGIITGDAIEVAHAQARMLKQGVPGVYIGGGETTIQLPPVPGRGGRNQSLALAVAQEIAGCDNILFLAAGTDGSDGPTHDAGAIVDGGTLQRGENKGLDAASYLMHADAGTFLAASGDLITTGPTGTNVMDLMLGLKAAP